ncbi:peroxisomal membrane protein, putative [Eimeria praecox]|uniref:Peroxisomal membrane protein, putative n=1 Tax=Eimeria praecox TaxID=51316 RepID=U6GXA9_9EIME|nr:peroxisomal membrane protein, putative [Eimeria praecox]
MARRSLSKTEEMQSIEAADEELENMPVFVSPIPIHPTPTLTRISTVGERMASADPEALLPAWKRQLRRSKSSESRKRVLHFLIPGVHRTSVSGQFESNDVGGHWMTQRANTSNRADDARTAAALAAAVAATASPRMSDATHAFLHTVAGAAGAVVAMAVVYPLDSLRTIQSVQGGSAWDVAKLHLRHGGWRRLYRGMKAALAGVVFSWGTYFFVYTLAKQKEKNRRGPKAKTGTNLPMAIGAGICSTVISNPFWVANTRLKVDFSAGTKEQGIFKMLIEILRKEGFRGWLAGIVPALVLVLNPAIQFTLYDHLRVKLMQLKQRWRTTSRESSSNSLSSQYSSTGSLVSDRLLRVRVTPAESFLMGLTAKLAATLVTYPYLVVKTRAQSKVYNVKDYSSSVRSLITILETEGLPGLFAGLPSKLTATLLSSAIMFTVYEQLLPLVVLLFRSLRVPHCRVTESCT